MLETAREMAMGRKFPAAAALQRDAAAGKAAADVLDGGRPPSGLGGVSEWSGRLPTVMLSWLLVGLCGHIVWQLYTLRAGLLTMGMFLTTTQLFRFGRLAEGPICLQQRA